MSDVIKRQFLLTRPGHAPVRLHVLEDDRVRVETQTCTTEDGGFCKEWSDWDCLTVNAQFLSNKPHF